MKKNIIAIMVVVIMVVGFIGTGVNYTLAMNGEDKVATAARREELGDEFLEVVDEYATLIGESGHYRYKVTSITDEGLGLWCLDSRTGETYEDTIPWNEVNEGIAEGRRCIAAELYSV